MPLKKLVIAIDGFSSCGKSTFAKQIAAKLEYIFIDSGAMYRAATLYALQNGIIRGKEIDEARLRSELNRINLDFTFNPAIHKSETYMNGENIEEKIRSLEVSNMVSEISKLGFVREKMVAIQRDLGKKGGIVMDGRDIGTVVFPAADLKLFMTASPDVRAQRRYKELKEKGQDVNIDEIKQNLLHRDRIDSTRADSPLKKADDAIELDNSNMSVEEQMVWVMQMIQKIQQK